MAESTSTFAKVLGDLDRLFDANKDAENTKIFRPYLNEKNADEPEVKKSLSKPAETAYVEARKEQIARNTQRALNKPWHFKRFSIYQRFSFYFSAEREILLFECSL